MKIPVTFCFAACALYGQAGKLAAPVLGYVFDQPAHALRRIQGIPGASVVGDPVDFGFAVSEAVVAPGMDSAFVLAGDGGVHLFRLTADAPRELAVGPLGAQLRVVFSPSGTAAALYSAGRAQVIKGLPDAPVLAATVSLHATPRPQRPVREQLAISDDGAYLLYGTTGPIELIGVAGVRHKAADGARDTIAAFAPGGHDAAVIDSGKLVLFQDIAGAATERSYPGIDSASALGFSPDGQKLFVASSGLKSVTTIQVATGERSATACDCTPNSLIRMGSVFRLSELSSAPLWLLDTGSERGMFFVPALVTN
jgi:hypothetical protein